MGALSANSQLRDKKINTDNIPEKNQAAIELLKKWREEGYGSEDISEDDFPFMVIDSAYIIPEGINNLAVLLISIASRFEEDEGEDAHYSREVLEYTSKHGVRTVITLGDINAFLADMERLKSRA